MTMKRRLLAATALFALAAAPDVLAQPREIVFVSDLHVGVGRQSDGTWHPTEDFRWHDDFAGFLQHLDDDLQAPVDLVVLGDFLELWQSAEKDCEHDAIDRDYGCTEDEAAKRVERVVAAHPKLFADLSAFIRTGENTLTIVPGNHDVALLMPGPRAALLAGFPEDVRGRVVLLQSALWQSQDGRVIAEHGQQIGADPNAFAQWPTTVWHEKDGGRYLVQSWGETFVQGLFNELESKHEIIDNFSGRLESIRYLRRASGWRDHLARVGDLVRFALFQQSWRQVGRILTIEDAEREAPWDLAASRATLGSDQARWNLLISAMPDDELREALKDEPAPLSAPLTDLEIGAACDAARRGPGRTLVAEAKPYCLLPGGRELGAAAEGIGKKINPELAAKIFQEYFDAMRTDPRTRGQAFVAYVYGHTHDEVPGKTPYVGAPVVFNDGAWQRTSTPEGLLALEARNPQWNGDVLGNVKLEDLAPCYPFVRLRPTDAAGKPNLELWYWSWFPRGGATAPTGAATFGRCDAPFWGEQRRPRME